MSDTTRALDWAFVVSHELRERLRLGPCPDGRHDQVCEALASGIASVIIGYGIPLPDVQKKSRKP